MADAPAQLSEKPAMVAPPAPAPAADAIGQKMKRVKDKAVNALKNISGDAAVVADSGNRGFILLMLVVATIIAFFVAILLYFAVSKTMAVSNTYVLPDSKIPVLCTKQTTLSGSSIPSANNGNRMTVSWWIYINDLITNQGQVRRVFSRGDKNANDDHISGFPYVGLDPQMNKVYVSFTTKDTSQYVMNGLNQANVPTVPFASATQAEKLAFRSNVHGIVFDYVPMQRWVHLAVVVNEGSSGGTVMGFVDGELVKTITSAKSLESTSNPITLGGTSLSNVKLEIQNLDMSAQGDVTVGGDSTNTFGFSGLVSSVAFTDTDLNANDIYQQYIQGPIGSYMTKMGLPAYGLQSPIYRLG